MKLGWSNILHDRVRFATTVLGIAFSVFLMLFQGSLLFGFLRAASKLIDTTEADLWVTARGVVCFDFSARLPKRYIEIAKGVPGVSSVARIAESFAEYRTPSGRHQIVALVGADPGVGNHFPVPRLPGSIAALAPDGVVVDASNADLLNASGQSVDIEINDRRARVLGVISGFSSFLGCPYVFTSYDDAKRYLNLGSEDAMYILLHVREGVSVDAVKRQLQARLPDVDVWTKSEFSRRSRLYWITQTGAGGGILMAAILGFFIGVAIVSQNMYATTMENLEEFATLRAIGASAWFIVKVVLTQALVCGVVGCTLGLIATAPLVNLARTTIAWITTPWWLPAFMIPPSLGMCVLAAIISVRAATSVEPAKVFRA